MPLSPSTATATTAASAASYATLALKHVVSVLQHTPPPDSTGYPHTHSPLFVTWSIITSVDSTLRGCIGNFKPLSLPAGVIEYACIAAFEDPRFHPLSSSELSRISQSHDKDLQCTVTLLHDFEDITIDPMNWDIGEHGLRVSFKLKNRTYHATFLPDVAVEQGWTKRDTLDALVQKGGASGPWADVVPVLVERYRGTKGSAVLSDVFSRLV
jgi:AMME syndrome candidate gene 1 protein